MNRRHIGSRVLRTSFVVESEKELKLGCFSGRIRERSYHGLRRLTSWQKKLPAMSSSSGKVRKELSADGLITVIREGFAAIPETDQRENLDILLSDALMSAFAMFSLKDPSLLAFDERRRDLQPSAAWQGARSVRFPRGSLPGVAGWHGIFQSVWGCLIILSEPVFRPNELVACQPGATP